MLSSVVLPGASGLVLLVLGAWLLVAGASGIARRLGVSPLVIGLTVVAFGTSAPELAVSVQGAWNGDDALAVGNVLGSNAFNVLGILGVTALIVPQAVETQIVRRDAPLLVLVSGLVWWLLSDGVMSWFEGIALLAIMAAYLVRLGRNLRAAHHDETTTAPARPRYLQTVPMQAAAVAIGLAALALGARWTVGAAVDLSRALGVSEAVIGVTVVAAATSLPELATSIVAALRGEREIAVGNIVGSNLFNLLVVLAGAAIVAPSGLDLTDAQLRLDVPIMMGTAVLLWLVLHTGRRVARAEGSVLVALLALWWAWLVLDATSSPGAEPFGIALRWFVVPGVATSFAALVLHEVLDRTQTPVQAPYTTDRTSSHPQPRPSSDARSVSRPSASAPRVAP